jgi:outer membrane biosynthesis protein TonB
MAVCVNCARELRPEWKFCVYCGTPTGVTSARAPEVAAATRAIPIIVMPDPIAEPEPVAEATPVVEPEPVVAVEPEPDDLDIFTPEPIPAAVAPPAPVPTAPAAPAPEPEPAASASHAPTLVLAPPEPAAAAPVISVRTRSRDRTPKRRVNALAVVALVLGCLASPLAALFGHLALAQLHHANERGRLPAIIAIALGYGSLAVIIIMAIVYLVGHA